MLEGMKLSADGWLCDVPVWGGVLSMRALHSPPATHNLEHAQPLWLEARKQNSACILKFLILIRWFTCRLKVESQCQASSDVAEADQL
jgi:hypothetical protein